VSVCVIFVYVDRGGLHTQRKIFKGHQLRIGWMRKWGVGEGVGVGVSLT